MGLQRVSVSKVMDVNLNLPVLPDAPPAVADGAAILMQFQTGTDNPVYFCHHTDGNHP